MRVRNAYDIFLIAVIITFFWRTSKLTDQTPRKMPSFQHGYGLSDSSPEPRFRYGELQVLVDKSTALYVGYYDDREEKAFVKIPALFNMRKTVFNFSCTVHYPDHSSRKVDAQLRRFQYSWMGNMSRNQWRQGYVMCPVSKERHLPSYVLLAIKGINNGTTNVTVKAPTKENNTLTRCIKQFIHNYDNVTQLVWNIEFLRILGVEKQIFYLNSQTERVLDVLKTYEKEGWVELRSFDLAKLSVQFPPKELQAVALQGCLLSEMHTSKYVIVVDVDEIIFPRVHKDIVEMADFLFEKGDSKGKSVGSLRFRLAFHPIDINITDVSFQYKDVAKKYNIHPLLHMTRYKTCAWAGPKSIVKPKSVDVMFIHFAENFVNGDHDLIIDDDIGVLHHYRKGTNPYLEPPLFINTEVFRFSGALVSAVEERFRVLEMNRKVPPLFG